MAKWNGGRRNERGRQQVALGARPGLALIQPAEGKKKKTQIKPERE